MFAVLFHPVYLRLFSAQVIALLGTGLTTVALALLANDLAGEDAGRVLGTALALKMVAYVVLAPIAGGLAGRLPRRAFLVSLDLIRAGFVLCLPFVTEVWQIYALILLMQGASAAFTPTFQATIPDVLTREEDYTRALSLSRLAYDIEAVLSPTLAGLALLFLSFGGLFFLNAVAFFVSAALILGTRLPRARAEEDETGSFLERSTKGIRLFLKVPRLRGLFALSMAVAAAGSMVYVNTVVYVDVVLDLPSNATAWALAAFGAGSMTAALILPRLLEAFGDRFVMMRGGVLLVLSLLPGLLLPGLWVFLLLWMMIGAGYSAVQVPVGRLLVRSSTESERPPLYAAQFALSHACWLVTYPLSGWVGSLFGLQAAFGVLLVLAFAALIAAARLWPRSAEEGPAPAP